MSSSLQLDRERVRGAVLGAAIGDALGHPTEFIRSFEEIRARFGPRGVDGYALYWERDGKRFAPYTDDTQMAEIVLRGPADRLCRDVALPSENAHEGGAAVALIERHFAAP